MTIINWVFRKKNPVFDMMKKTGGRMSKGYPYCTANRFQDGKLFRRSIVLHIS